MKLTYRMQSKDAETSIFFFVLYRCMAGLGFTPGWEKDVDETIRKRAFVSMLNLIYLGHEYRLAHKDVNEPELAAPSEIAQVGEIFREVKLDKNHNGRLDKSSIEEFIHKANYICSIYRRHLSSAVFDSPRYKANLISFLENTGPSKTVQGFSDYGVGKNTEVYKIERGLFRFYFIEERGELKVLTLGFEC